MSENMYENGKIYKITDAGYNKCYYGSTVQSLANRMAGHRAHYAQYKKSTRKHIAQIAQIFDEYGVENCKIELVELFPCANKMELRKKEGEYIKSNECVNRQVAGRSRQDYRNDNKDKIREMGKRYRETHKEELAQQKKDYVEQNREAVLQKKKEHYHANKEYYAQYKKDRADEIRAQHQRYYATNREAILAKDKEKRLANVEKNKERYKKYYEDNKEIVLAKKKEKRDRMKAARASMQLT